MSRDIRTLRFLLLFSFFCLAILIASGSTAAAGSLPAVADHPSLAAVRPAASAGDRPSALTDADGAFRFAGLERGTHQFYLDPTSLPAGLRPPADAPLAALWINPGQSLVSDPIGAGVRLSASYDRAGTTISGVVFVDADGDGQRDPAEAGLAGVTVVDPTVHQYFVPFNDDDLWTLLAEINDPAAPAGIGQCLFNSATSRDLNSFLSLTASSDGTTYYYDHWEDDYDPDPLLPGPTTEVGVIDAGVTQIFNDIVVTPRTTDTLVYDGRDRITIFGEPASVIRAFYPMAPGEVLAGALEVPEVSDWGQYFVPVIGEDLDFNGPGVVDDFDYVGLQVMAAQPGTQVWVNGVLEATLGIGETYLIDGENGLTGDGVQSGDIITATGPVQVQMLGAACEIAWSARAYTLQPVDVWDNDYWAPVPDFTEGPWCPIDLDPGVDDRDTDIYIHNHNLYPITVTFDDSAGPIPLNVPSHTTISVLAAIGRDLSNLTSAHLYSPDAFWGVSAIDSISGNSAVGSLSNVNDWGYSLIPLTRLSSQVVLGWSPGNSLVPPTSNPAENNGNLAFASALTDTVVYVDFTQDGLPDAFDINGDGDADDLDVFGNPNFDERASDDGIALARGQVLRASDPNDNDLTGAVIYTLDLGAKLAVAWGQDPCRSRQGFPYLDMGYTVLPVPIPSLSKQAELAVDADLSGDVSPGDTISYTLILHNNGLGPLLDGILSDTVPYTYTDFVVGSLAVSQPPPLGSLEYYDGPNDLWGYTPTPTPDGDDPAVWAFRLSWPVIGPGETITITFAILLDDDIPPEVEEISNLAIFSSEDTGTTTSQDPDDPQDPDTDVSVEQPILQIDKIDQPDPVRPGQLLTYTIVVSNTGNGTAIGALALERLPSYVTYQPGTLNLTLPSVLTREVTMTVPYTANFTGSYADDFDLTAGLDSGYTGNDGSLTWSTDWTELGDDDDPAAGDVLIGAPGLALSPAGHLQTSDVNGLDSGATRAVDLSEFVAPTLSFYVLGVSQPGDTFDVRANGVSLPGFPQRYNGAYQQRVVDLSAYAGQPAVTLALVANANMEAADFYRFDNVVLFEASPLRSGTHTLVDVVSVLTYTTQTGIDPVAYDPVTNFMTVTEDVRIPPGAQVRFSFQVRVASPLPNGTQLLNTATITSTNVVTNPFPLEDDEPTTVLSSHALTITKRSTPDTVFIGQQLTYTLFWEVGGDEPAPGVVVTDTIPWPYVSFVDCDGGLGCSFTSPDTVVWELGDRLPIASGILYESGWLTLTARVEAYPPGGVFTNTATIDDDTDVPPDEDDESTNVIDAGFVLSKRRVTPSPVAVDDPVQFLIVITNTGALTITRLPLEDAYDTTFLSYQGATPASDDNLDDGVINWSDLTTVYGPLAPGANAQVVVDFVAITSTQHLTPPVTPDTATSAGAEIPGGVLPPVQDDDDVEIEPGGPTAIELLYFRAAPKAGGVLVEWATLYEIDTYGFWLYRGEDADLDHAVPVTFVPARGWLGLGATYQYLDAGLPPGLYSYWLIEVENSGRQTPYGPISASSGWDEADWPYRVYLPLIRKP